MRGASCSRSPPHKSLGISFQILATRLPLQRAVRVVGGDLATRVGKDGPRARAAHVPLRAHHRQRRRRRNFQRRQQFPTESTLREVCGIQRTQTIDGGLCVIWLLVKRLCPRRQYFQSRQQLPSKHALRQVCGCTSQSFVEPLVAFCFAFSNHRLRHWQRHPTP